MRLAFDAIDSDGGTLTDEDVAFFFRQGNDWGRIRIDRRLASAVVNRALGTGASVVERSLGRGERGVLAAALVETLRILGSSWRISLQTIRPPGAAPSLTLRIKVDGPDGAGGIAFVDIPRRWLEGGRAVSEDEAPRIETVAAVELATTRLPAREWIAVSDGDAVVFDGVSPATGTTDWAVRIRVGSHAAPATIDPAGTIRLLDGFRPAPIASGRIVRKNEERMDDNGDSKTPGRGTIEATQVLAGAPIEIVAELGRIVVRGDEILSLTRGGVVSFAGPRSTAISLRVGDEIWARGELVDVDGELGVRITETVSQDPASRAR
ncbi:MAG TPA: FliM/FliN family flagellar motor switch protein [Polyangia bacterium]|nr:FliM/FliN family flagellar motor switch protein [Polyangia bacterium]